MCQGGKDGPEGEKNSRGAPLLSAPMLCVENLKRRLGKSAKCFMKADWKPQPIRRNYRTRDI